MAITPRLDIAQADRKWFNATCRQQAYRVARYHPELYEDVEAECRVAAWVAYRERKTKSQVAWRAYCAGIEYYRAIHGRGDTTQVNKPDIKRRGQKRDFVNCLPLTCTRENGDIEDGDWLPTNLGGIDTLLQDINFDWIISNLPPVQAEIMIRHYQDGVSLPSIGKILNLAPVSVRYRYQLALKYIRETILNEITP